eukprot:3462907-Amphidinium_carterae.1
MSRVKLLQTGKETPKTLFSKLEALKAYDAKSLQYAIGAFDKSVSWDEVLPHGAERHEWQLLCVFLSLARVHILTVVLKEP